MRKITLFEEINRMKTLMNVKVLTEAPLPTSKTLEKSAEELWNYSKKLFVRGTERTAEESIESALNRLKKIFGPTTEVYLESLSRRIATEGAEKVEKEIIEFLAYNKTFQEKIFKELEEKFQSEVEEILTKTATSPEMMQTFDGLFISALDRSNGDVESAKEILRILLADELSDERILEKYFEHVEVKQDSSGGWIIKPKQEPDIINPRPVQTTRPVEDLTTDPELVTLSDDVSDELNRIYSENEGKTTQNLGQTYIPGTIRFFTKYWTNMLTSNEKLLLKIEKTLSEITKKLDKNPPESVEIDMENLYMLILGLRKTRSKNVLSTVDKLIVNNSKLRPEVRKLWQNDKIKASYDAMMIAETKNAYGPLEDQVRAWAKSFPVTNFIEHLSSREKTTLKDTWRILFPEPQKLANVIAWKDPRSTAEVIQHMTRYGRNSVIASKVKTWLVMNTMVIPYLVASFKQVGANYKRNKAKVDYQIAKELCDMLKELNPDDPKICDKLPQIPEKPSEEDFKKWFKGALPFDIFGVHPYGEKVGNSILKNVLFWTYLDEIGSMVWDGWQWVNYGEVDTENLNRLFEVLDKKTQKNLRDLGWDMTKTNEENLAELRKRMANEIPNPNPPQTEQPIENTLDGFKQFCSKTEDVEFRREHNIDKKYTFLLWNELSSKTNELTPKNENDWQWIEGEKIFKPY